MHNQPKYRPLRETAAFSDGRTARAPVAGTVARGELREDKLFYTGKTQEGDAIGATIARAQGASAQGGTATTGAYRGFSTVFPFPVTKEVLDRGQERFNIFCSVCHDRSGSGLGMVVRRGYRQPPSFHIDRLRQAPPGYIFDVITNGFGAMPDYASQIPARDRWAIVAYIRALQLAQQGKLEDVPAADREKLNSAGQSKEEGRQ